MWRVGYNQADNEVAPRKPLYLWQKTFRGKDLSANACVRLVLICFLNVGCHDHLCARAQMKQSYEAKVVDEVGGKGKMGLRLMGD